MEQGEVTIRTIEQAIAWGESWQRHAWELQGRLWGARVKVSRLELRVMELEAAAKREAETA